MTDLPPSNLEPKLPSQSFSSWGAAFQSAAKVKPEDLGNFQPPEEDPNARKYGAGNVSSVGALAQQSLKNKPPDSDLKRKANKLDEAVSPKKAKKSKKEKKSVKKDKKSKKAKKDKKKKRDEPPLPEEPSPYDRDSSQSVPTLEGQMVTHQGESILVLVDNSDNIVYSMNRTEAGDLIPIGSIVSGQIKITASQKECDDFPYPVDADDHCESPANSYGDIKAILQYLASNKKDFTIYDPYYCNGLVRENLKEMGYSNVYNKKEDAYVTWDPTDTSQPYPPYDVFITNPPYSGEHPESLVRHLMEHKGAAGKPWCLLMPQYVHKKDYYKSILAKKGKKGIQPFYLIPKKRYVYLPPKNFREKKNSDVHKKSSPFVSMWYIWGGTMEKTEELIKEYIRSDQDCEIARTTSALRDLRRKGKRK